jgi:hypothetical protein
MHHEVNIDFGLWHLEYGWNLPIFLFVSYGMPLAEI